MPSTPDEAEDTKHVAIKIPQGDALARREKLNKITKLGLKHMEDKKVKVTILGHEIGLQDAVGQVGNAVDWALDYIKDAIKDVPYAPAVMAAISLVLPLLKNPAVVEAANREGFMYVTSQMRYYIGMESFLLPEDMKPDLKADLTQRVIDLYKLIISFEVQCAIRFYRNRTKNYFRGTINYDRWDEKLASIKEQERELDKKFYKAISGAGLQKLKDLALEAKTSRKNLDNILGEIQDLVIASRSQRDLTEKIHQRMSDDEDRRRRDTLQASDPTLDKVRIEDEKGGLLRDSYCWILDHMVFQWWRDSGGDQLLWIKGDAGKGKTMLLCGIIDELIRLAGHTANISFFFCQATDSRINNATAVLRGLIYLLVIEQPSLTKHIHDSSFEGPNAWFALSRVFNDILEDPLLQKTYVVIDALDECSSDLARLLKFIVQKSSTYSHVKWVVSSRKWSNIKTELDDAAQLKLDLEFNQEAVSASVNSFIESRVKWLAKRKKFDQETKDIVQEYLSLKSNGTFLWVALVCKELVNVERWEVQEKLKEFPPGLTDLYKRMLNQVCVSEHSKLCASILGLVSVVYRPITLDELTSLIDLPKTIANYEDLTHIIGLCGSFLTLREHISLVHLSAKEFLIEKASRELFPCGVGAAHHAIFIRSLEVMAKTLKRDIYKLGSPGYPIEEVEQRDPDSLAAARYPCVYGIDHLQDCDPTKYVKVFEKDGPVDIFLQEKFLYWIEALSLLRSMSKGVASILRLDKLVKVSFQRCTLGVVPTFL